MDQLTILFIGVIIFAVIVFIAFSLIESGKQKHKQA